MRQTLPPPEDFLYPEYIYRKPVKITPEQLYQRVKMDRPFYSKPRHEQLMDYALVANGYRPRPGLSMQTKNVIDMTIKLAENDADAQYVEITLHANEHTQAKTDKTLIREYKIQSYMDLDDLEYLRDQMVRKLLTGNGL